MAKHPAIVGHLLRRDTAAAADLTHRQIHHRLDQITEVIHAGYVEIYTENVLAVHVLGETV